MFELEHYTKLSYYTRGKEDIRLNLQPSHIAIFQVSVLPSTDRLRHGTRDCQVEDVYGRHHSYIQIIVESLFAPCPVVRGLEHNNSTSLSPA